jgi:uncharacterized protein (TIGR02246 family)
MIRSFRFTLGVLGLALVIGFGLFLPAAPASAATGGVEAIDLAWKKAFVANDLEAVLACYAPDAVAWLPDTPEAKGATAIRESFKAFLGANTIRDFTMSDTHYEIHGDRAVGWGRFVLTLVPKAGDGAGKTVSLAGRFSEVAAKRDGRWVYLVDHASIEPPPSISLPPK